MTDKRKKRPRDANQLAKSIVDIATGDEEDRHVKAAESDKDSAMSELGRAGGLKGGKARAKKLTSTQRSEIARLAATARWSSKKDDS